METPATVFVVNYGRAFEQHEPMRFATLEAALGELYRRRLSAYDVALHAEIGPQRITLLRKGDDSVRLEAILDLVNAQEAVAS